MKKILILRFSSIGDIVLTTPVIRALKLQIPGVQIHYCTKPSFKALVAHNPYLDKVHYLPDKLTDLIAELQAEEFNYIVDLHNNLRSRLIRFKLGVPGKGFPKLNLQKWLLVNLKINRMPPVHIVDRYLEAAARLGVKNDGQGLDYFIPPSDEVALTSLPQTHQKGYVAFAIGAQHATKRLPVARMIELCGKINRPIILLGGKEDAHTGNQIQQYFEKQNQEESTNNEKRTTIYNACGRYNLNQSASLVRQADVVFSHDTGLMHVAAAFGKKIYSIWGNTVPELGMYPYHTNFEVLENRDIKCRPCSKIGYNECPQGHFKCMWDIRFDDLII